MSQSSIIAKEETRKRILEKLKPLNLREETVSGFDEIGLVTNTFFEEILTAIQEHNRVLVEKVGGMKMEAPHSQDKFHKLAEEGEAVTLNNETVPKAFENAKMISDNMWMQEYRAGFNKCIDSVLELLSEQVPEGRE